METYTVQQRIQIIQLFYENGRSNKNVFRKLRDFYDRHNRPNESTILRIVKKFEETGSVMDVKTPIRHRPSRSQENIDAVRESVEADPRMSIPRRSQELNIPKTTVWRILHKDLSLKAYKVQLTQELKPTDHLKRREFVNFIEEKPDGFSKKNHS